MTTNDKVFYPETIQSNPLPVVGDIVIPATTQSSSGESVVNMNGGSSSKDTVVNEVKLPVVVQRPLPFRDFATELLSSTLNTRSKKILGEFSFGKLGAIQIGDWEKDPTHGDIRISPDGMTARNKAGTVTFSLDGDTGDASFLGTLSAGAIIASDRIYLGEDGIYIKDDNNIDVIFIGIEVT